MSKERSNFGKHVAYLLKPLGELVTMAADFFLSIGPLEAQPDDPRRASQAAKLGSQSLRGF